MRKHPPDFVGGQSGPRPLRGSLPSMSLSDATAPLHATVLTWPQLALVGFICVIAPHVVTTRATVGAPLMLVNCVLYAVFGPVSLFVASGLVFFAWLRAPPPVEHTKSV